MTRGYLEIEQNCTVEEIRNFKNNCPEELPDTYVHFIAENHSVEGDLPCNPFYFRLWKANEVMENNVDYEVKEYIPTYFAIGDQGGGEMFVISLKDKKVYLIPFVPIDEEAKIECFESFTMFIKNMGWRSEEA